MMSTARFTLAMCLAVSVATAAGAGPFPRIAFMGMGYSEATKAMLTGTANLADREADPSGFLAVSADFNADGRTDEARILVNPAERQFRIVAVIQSATKVDTYVLKTLPLDALATIGIRLAPAGVYEAACPPCTAGKVTTSRPSIMIFEFGGSAQLETHPSDSPDDDFQSILISLPKRGG